jgi:hypothetical protein
MDDGCFRNPRTHILQAGEQTAMQLKDEERVEKIPRKSRKDHERGPLHSAGLPARYRGSMPEDVGKLRAAGVIQGTVHLWQVSQRNRVRRLNRLGQIVRQGWRVVIRLLVLDKLIVRYMVTEAGQATHHLVCIHETHAPDVHF